MNSSRFIFGLLAFGTTILVVGLVLSPWVPDSKEAIANVILGNVLGWPAIVLAFHFGSTQGSAEKNRVIADLADTTTPKPVEVMNLPSQPIPVEVPEPEFGGRNVPR